MTLCRKFTTPYTRRLLQHQVRAFDVDSVMGLKYKGAAHLSVSYSSNRRVAHKNPRARSIPVSDLVAHSSSKTVEKATSLPLNEHRSPRVCSGVPVPFHMREVSYTTHQYDSAAGC